MTVWSFNTKFCRGYHATLRYDTVEVEASSLKCQATVYKEKIIVIILMHVIVKYNLIGLVYFVLYHNLTVLTASNRYQIVQMAIFRIFRPLTLISHVYKNCCFAYHYNSKPSGPFKLIQFSLIWISKPALLLCNYWCLFRIINHEFGRHLNAKIIELCKDTITRRNHWRFQKSWD